EFITAEKLLAPHFSGSVKSLVIIGVVGFRRRQMLCQSVYGGAGTVDYLFDLMLCTKISHFESGFQHYIKSIPGVGCAGIDAEGRHVENIIGAGNTFFQQGQIPDIPFVKFNQRVIDKAFHICPASADQVIDDDDLFWLQGKKFFYNIRSDKSCASCYQDNTVPDFILHNAVLLNLFTMTGYSGSSSTILSIMNTGLLRLAS